RLHVLLTLSHRSARTDDPPSARSEKPFDVSYEKGQVVRNFIGSSDSRRNLEHAYRLHKLLFGGEVMRRICNFGHRSLLRVPEGSDRPPRWIRGIRFSPRFAKPECGGRGFVQGSLLHQGRPNATEAHR